MIEYVLREREFGAIGTTDEI